MVPIETKIEDCPKIEENLKPEMKLVNNFRIKFDEIKDWFTGFHSGLISELILSWFKPHWIQEIINEIKKSNTGIEKPESIQQRFSCGVHSVAALV